MRRYGILIAFSSLCNGIACTVFCACLYLLVMTFVKRSVISTGVIIFCFGLVADIVLLYLSRIAIVGDTAQVVKKTTPFAPSITKNKLIMLVAFSVTCLAMVLFMFSNSSVSNDVKEQATSYLEESEMLEDTTLLQTLPTLVTDDIYASAVFLRDAYALQDNRASVEAQAQFNKSSAYYDKTKSMLLYRAITTILCSLLYGFCFTLIRLRSDYVLTLKEMEKKNGHH